MSQEIKCKATTEAPRAATVGVVGRLQIAASSVSLLIVIFNAFFSTRTVDNIEQKHSKPS